MTYSSTSCIVIPICMFGEELAREKDASAYARQIEKYLSAFLCFREKEYKHVLEEMETIGQTSWLWFSSGQQDLYSKIFRRTILTNSKQKFSEFVYT